MDGVFVAGGVKVAVSVIFVDMVTDSEEDFDAD